MAHNSNIGFFVMIGSSLLAAALLVALLVGGEIAGPNVAFNGPSSTSAGELPAGRHELTRVR
jgi:hypothetical protein